MFLRHGHCMVTVIATTERRGSGKHLRGLLEQSTYLLFPRMPSRYSGGSLYICISTFFFSIFFCCLHWTDSCLYMGRQKVPLFSIVIIVALFLLLASCT